MERIVGSAKRALLQVIKPEVAVTDEELLTAFAMVEAVLNARPLTYVGSDFHDLEPPTPEHFLGTSNTLALGLPNLSVQSQFYLLQGDHVAFHQTLSERVRSRSTA